MVFLISRNIKWPELRKLGGFNATVAGWGSFHDIKCTTNEHGPSQNERCEFPFKENTLSEKQEFGSVQTVTYNSCTYAANPGTKNPVCKDFYHNVHKLHPFPKFPVLLEAENETVVCHNNTHGRFGWCRTQKHAEEDGGGLETKEADLSFPGEEDNWGWCRKHCHNTNVMLRSKAKHSREKTGTKKSNKQK